MIDRETVDRIYAAANIVDIVGDFVTLKRKGVNYQACCPFHNEKTPSFVVSPSKGVYKCFGCGKGGNAVTFLMEHENVTYPEALKMVAKRYGIEVKEKELTPEEERRNNDRESMFALNGWAADYFADYLHHEGEGMSVGMAYFRQTRGMTDATIQKFGLGFCPAKGDKMSKDALAAGYKEEFLLSTGLSLKRESDGSLFDRFHDRVMFPVHNISGRIVAFGGRTLRTDKKVAKYQNSPESEIYSKKRELYGLYFAKKAIQQQDFAIMVEGYTDVISMHQAGVENVVASSGTSLTTEQIRLLNRFTKNITVIYDGDSAGIHASLRGIDMILKEGMNVRVVLLPEPEDPDSFARSHTAAELQEYIRANEQDFLAFKAKLLLEDAQGDPIKKASLIGDMVQSIAQIPDSIQRAVYIKECARIMEIDEQILISEVARKRLSTTGDRETDEFVRRQTTLRRETPREPEVEYVREVEAGSSTDALERELCKYLLKYGHCSFDFKEGRTMVACNVAEVIFDELADGGLTFRNPQYDKIRAAYCEQWQQSGVGVEVPAHLFTNHSDPEVCNVSVDLLFSDDNYVPSELWKRKDVHVESDAEMLAVGVPKAVALYKTKVIEGLIKECQAKLGDELTDEQVTEIMQRLAALNRAKVTMARKLQRLIL
ncbi:MAG: DNA primase [Alistipes sp.]|jgi:DNA primase|uniref:DNA primase n=1 Tax=uncultured Alistipes sp. TaxID=538949 RepID=UPI0025951481|nr:DNA primase [uncultured Alistipes sp.]MCI9244360.1 DNA primase [Alistipes sp.]